MLYPKIDDLMDKADSKYSLVVLAAKRARNLLDGEKTQIETHSNKYVGSALEEIDAGIIKVPPRDQ